MSAVALDLVLFVFSSLSAMPGIGARENVDRVVNVQFYDVNRHEERTFEITLDGQVRGDATVRDVQHFFRCRRSGRQHTMDARLLRMLAVLSDHYEGRTIEIVSAFRRRGIGAPHSKHYRGQAIDLRVRGIPLRAVRDYIWNKYQEVGVGHYHEQNFLHIDYRTVAERVAWTQRRPNAANQYNPWWSREVVFDFPADDLVELDFSPDDLRSR